MKLPSVSNVSLKMGSDSLVISLNTVSSALKFASRRSDDPSDRY